MGGTEVKIRLKKINIQWSIITDAENPQKNWYQKSKFTKACKTDQLV